MPGATHQRFDRATWSALRAATPLTLDDRDLDELRGINEALDLDEVIDVYLPLSRLLNLRVAAAQSLARVTDTFLGRPARRIPFLLGVAGSVAVGKSTTARILRALLARWPDHPSVDLVATDGFLWPNATLEERGLMDRKGFPESYDTRRLLQFLVDLKSGADEVSVPVYSHERYDVLPAELQLVRGADVVVVEGLNVLQPGPIADQFDFAIYVDADEADILHWYIERFQALRGTVFRRQQSFFRHFAELDDAAAAEMAKAIWNTINGPNLVDNILPTRERADLVLYKGGDHRVAEVLLRL